MRSSLFFFAVMLLLALASCSNNNKAFEQYLATADSTHFSSDITNPHSASRKILHSADLSYRVQDVLKTTTQTEQWVKGLGGIVTKSEMHNETVSVKDMPYKSDSLKHVQIYAPTASLVVKVPVEKMDSFITMLSTSTQFVIHRTIAQQDMTFAYLSNALKNQNAANPEKPVHYTPPYMDANAMLAERNKDKDAADEQVDRKIENLQMLEEADYATLTISYTQPEQIDVQVTADTAYAIQTPFGTQLMTALRSGIATFRGMLLLIVQLWPLWLIAFIVWSIYKRKHKPLPVNKQV